MFLGALGTDTGGSIRMPAAFCGITGMKATYGLVPKAGCYPLGVTYDHIGPMTRSAADAALMLEVLAGFDPADPTMIPDIEAPVVTGRLDGDLSGVTIGVDRANHLGLDGADPALEGCFEAALAVLADAGAEVVDVALPLFDEMVTADLYGFMTEALSYHQRFLRTRWSDYGKPARMFVGAGAFCTGADYAQAQKVRRVGKAALDELMTTVDLVVSPTAAIGAPAVDGLSLDGLIDLLFTPYWNTVGNPAISVPMGFTDAGLPLGLHIAGRPLGDVLVLRAADAYQRTTDFHLRVPTPLLATSS
jgi:aspartyl-tRNA(Asn)/glutamyl-tRNA(Gln) amidotransferase subunit A